MKSPNREVPEAGLLGFIRGTLSRYNLAFFEDQPSPSRVGNSSNSAGSTDFPAQARRIPRQPVPLQYPVRYPLSFIKRLDLSEEEPTGAEQIVKRIFYTSSDTICVLMAFSKHNELSEQREQLTLETVIGSKIDAWSCEGHDPTLIVKRWNPADPVIALRDDPHSMTRALHDSTVACQPLLLTEEKKNFCYYAIRGLTEMLGCRRLQEKEYRAIVGLNIGWLDRNWQDIQFHAEKGRAMMPEDKKALNLQDGGIDCATKDPLEAARMRRAYKGCLLQRMGVELYVIHERLNKHLCRIKAASEFLGGKSLPHTPLLDRSQTLENQHINSLLKAASYDKSEEEGKKIRDYYSKKYPHYKADINLALPVDYLQRLRDVQRRAAEVSRASGAVTLCTLTLHQHYATREFDTISRYRDTPALATLFYFSQRLAIECESLLSLLQHCAVAWGDTTAPGVLAGLAGSLSLLSRTYDICLQRQGQGFNQKYDNSKIIKQVQAYRGKDPVQSKKTFQRWLVDFVGSHDTKAMINAAKDYAAYVEQAATMQALQYLVQKGIDVKEYERIQQSYRRFLSDLRGHNTGCSTLGIQKVRTYPQVWHQASTSAWVSADIIAKNRREYDAWIAKDCGHKKVEREARIANGTAYEVKRVPENSYGSPGISTRELPPSELSAVSIPGQKLSQAQTNEICTYLYDAATLAIKTVCTGEFL